MRITVLTLIVMSIISVLIFKYGKPYRRGFWCSDKSIFNKYYPIMIPMNYLLLLAASIPTASMVWIELKFNKSSVNNLFRKLTHFYFGLELSFILCLITKNLFGRLRPNSIIGLCNAGHYCESDSTQYISEFICVNRNPKFVRDSRLSFYSGHSSVGTYSAFYLIIFIYYRLKINFKLKFSLQILVLLIGLIPGFTQGITYWHHLSDILTGYTVGGLTAYAMNRFISKLRFTQ